MGGVCLQTTSLPLTVVLSKCSERIYRDKDKDGYKTGDKEKDRDRDKGTALKGAVDNECALTVSFEGFCRHGSLHG